MRIFVTGLTGTLGTALALLHQSRGDQVWGCSRSEERAVRWLDKHPRLATLFLTDCLELNEDTRRALATCDRCYHCAAMKHVDLCEANPWEAFKQNVGGTRAIASDCQVSGVPLVFVSSDKACLPQGVYGATKLLGERIILRAGGAVVRLGNLVGSSGSVFAAWRETLRDGKPIRVTDPEMTRYFLGVDEAARFMADRTIRGRVVIPYPLKAARIGDLAAAVATRPLVTVTGRRDGETQHQWLVAPGEKVLVEGDRLVLGEGETQQDGRCSASAERWEPAELLRLAGC